MASPHPRPIRVCPPALRPRRPMAPVEARVLLRMLRIELVAGGLVLLHRHLALLGGPEVLFALPLAAARILEDRDPRKVDRAAAARMVATVLHVEEDPAALLVDRVPLVPAVELAILLH